MHLSHTPITPSWRETPPIAAQPEPGLRLLHGMLVS